MAALIVIGTTIVLGTFYLGIKNRSLPFAYLNKSLSPIDDIEQYCKNSKTCPSDYCETACVGGGPELGCIGGCVPKDCQDFDASMCPKGRCQVWKNNSGKDICYYKLNDNRKCGEAGYYGQVAECCEGFVRRSGKVLADGTCDYTKGGYQNLFPTCLACGNGVCEKIENKCNCPEDCSK